MFINVFELCVENNAGKRAIKLHERKSCSLAERNLERGFNEIKIFFVVYWHAFCCCCCHSFTVAEE